jgi:hypothetical protein
MKTNGNDKSLESYKAFPFIAWGTSLLFAFFVYNITVELQEVTTDLHEQTTWIETQANTQTEAIVDFEG